ncbi:hypothetical protein LX36DRAFT_657767 [Colletotrichum falcatum]|nr:hypothetical protein LX36DRAFT_657767 [Colletotrichum falcatum]
METRPDQRPFILLLLLLFFFFFLLPSPSPPDQKPETKQMRSEPAKMESSRSAGQRPSLANRESRTR